MNKNNFSFIHYEIKLLFYYMDSDFFKILYAVEFEQEKETERQQIQQLLQEAIFMIIISIKLISFFKNRVFKIKLMKMFK